MSLGKSVVVVVCTLLLSVGCATKYKTYSSAASFKASAERIKGKTPKEAKEIMGMPMSAYYNADKTEYYMVYPQNETEVSMTDLMFNDRLECLFLNFEKQNDFKFDGWSSNVGGTCGAIKGNALDTSLLE